MQSAIYEGKVRHRRLIAPIATFEYSLFMVYIDLSELDAVFEGRVLWSTRSPNVAWLRRRDHHGDPRLPLDEVIRAEVAARTGARPDGPIRLLTHLRYYGYGFNPVSFFYCFAKDGERVDAVVAEVSNTPWGERHLYVLPLTEHAPDGSAAPLPHAKEFHVSPFFPMDLDYAWRFGLPGDRLWVHVASGDLCRRAFEASLSLERRPIDGRELARALLVHPAMTAKVVAAIYLEAFKLWLRRARWYDHPAVGARRSHAS